MELLPSRACENRLRQPLWRPVPQPMRIHRSPARTRVPWGPLAVLGLGLLATWLTLAQGLPRGADSSFHLYRLVERHHLISQGVLFSRWSPWLGNGYGFPLYNYYPPLLYYLAEPLLLLGLGPVVALRIVLSLALMGAGLGMYCFVRDIFGAGPGIAAAAAYVFSPYLMYTLTTRAGFPEILALAWMPWALWAFGRHANSHSRRFGVLATVLLAAILLTHLFSAFAFLASLSLWASLLATLGRTRSCFVRRLLALMWPLGLGLVLAAFFWLPAIGEADLVQLERAVEEIADPSRGQGLLTPRMIFIDPLPQKRGLAEASIPPRLNGLTLGLALFGAIAGLSALRPRPQRRHVLTGLLVVGGALFMLTPASRWLWQTIPMLRLAQFPFRFLGVGGLWLSLLVGAGVSAAFALLACLNLAGVCRGLATTSLAILVCVGMMLYVFGQSPAAVYSPETPTDLKDSLEFEQGSGMIGLVAASEYLPKTVRALPSGQMQPSTNYPRLEAATLPKDAYVVTAHYAPLHYEILVESARPFRAVLNTFYFPGWWATAGGKPLTIQPTDPHGLISLVVPAGRQQIEVGFGPTLVRSASTGLSLLGLTVAMALLAVASRRSALRRNSVPSVANSDEI